MIPKYSVKRPYTVLVAVVLVIVLGVVSLTRMTTDLLPPMNLPYVIVVTTDVGASPEEVEKDVTSPIEAAMQRQIHMMHFPHRQSKVRIISIHCNELSQRL